MNFKLKVRKWSQFITKFPIKLTHLKPKSPFIVIFIFKPRLRDSLNVSIWYLSPRKLSVKFFLTQIFEKIKHLVMKRNFRKIPLSWGAYAGDILDVRNSRPIITHRPRWNLPTDKIYHTNLNLLSTNSKLKQSVYGWVKLSYIFFKFVPFWSFIPPRGLFWDRLLTKFLNWLNFWYNFFYWKSPFISISSNEEYCVWGQVGSNEVKRASTRISCCFGKLYTYMRVSMLAFQWKWPRNHVVNKHFTTFLIANFREILNHHQNFIEEQ